jgi:hypothetical protein
MRPCPAAETAAVFPLVLSRKRLVPPDMANAAAVLPAVMTAA